MRIYIIPAWYPDENMNGGGSFVRDQAHALANREHDITVIHITPISFTHLLRQKKHSVRFWQDGNVRTFFHKVVIPIPGKIADAQDGYLLNLYKKIISEQIREDEKNGLFAPDLLHAHVSHSCAYYCLKASKELTIPLVVTEHYSGLLLGTATEREYQRVHDTIENADAFIFVGSNFQKTLCSRLKTTKETYVVPNMVDTSFFNVKQESNKGFSFLTACSLKKNKSVNLVIEAFHLAFSDNDDVKLVIAGDGDELHSLQVLCESYHLQNRISFFGRYTREQAKEIFSQADAFVLPSQVETFGIVYIEALASGVPCIGTKGQGADDIIDENNGFLVEYGNVDELAQKMRYLYFNRDKYDSQQIRRQCIEKFDREAVCDQIEDVYREVLGTVKR